MLRHRRAHVRYLRFLERAPWDDRQAMDELRSRLLAALVADAVRLPFHAERFAAAGIRPEAVRTIDDLAGLPILTKQELNAVPRTERFDGSGRFGRTVVRGTSGTSAESFLFDVEELFDARTAAVRTFIFNQAGLRSGLVLETFHGDGIRRLRSNPRFRIAQMGYKVPLERQLEVLRELGPDALYGNRAALIRYADALGADDGPPVRIGHLLSTAELLLPPDRTRLAAELSAEVHDLYGAAECPTTAFQLHWEATFRVLDPRVILEVLVDGRPCGPGESGDVVVTALDSGCAPFIRYATGDVVTLAPDSPPSGSAGMRLAHLQGRRLDVVRRPDGSAVFWPQLIDETLWSRPDVADAVGGYQFVQARTGELRVLLQPRNEVVPMGLLREIEARVGAALGPEVRIELEQVDDIPHEPNGKFRAIRSLL